MLCLDPSIPNNWTLPIVSTKKECYVDSLSVLLNILLMLMTFVVILRYKCTKIEKKHGELVRYHEHCSRSVLTLCLVFLNLMEIGEGIIVNQFNSTSKLHIILTPVTSLLSTLSAILFYHYVERLNRPKLLLILFVFWPVAATLKLAKLVVLYGMGLNIYHMKITVTWAVTIVYSLLTAIDATLIIVQQAAEKSWSKNIPMEMLLANFLALIIFGGMMKISGDVVSLAGPLSISFILAYVTAVKEETLPHGTLEQLYYPTSWEFIQNGFVMTVIVLIATFLQSTLSNNFNHLAIAEGTHLRTALQDVSDERLKKTTELLQGIKLLKLYGWDRLYANFVQIVREKELKILRSDAICVAFNTFITQTSSIIVTLVTFSIFSKMEGRPLMPVDVFTGLALFNQLTVPLYIIPFVIPMVINAVVSTNRLVDFLMLPEVDLSLPWRDDSDAPDARVEFVPDSGSVLLHVKENSFDGSKGYLSGSEDGDGVFLPEFYNYPPVEENVLVSIKKGYFAYDSSYTIPSLRDINVQIPAGKLTIIVGNIGSGKSSLLSAILGELHVISGSINWNSSPLVAYVPQKPWLMNATLKENILFGQPYDGRRYHQGDSSIGGQKQRIALARAFYSPARLIILDDPLSALDAHVGAYVFEHGIKTLLLRRQRTVILVTHKLEFLSSATKVILMESGTIKKRGSSLKTLRLHFRI
ncbi:ATP-binding cassette sub-family C member 9 [Caerostris extrusa]|uniref:ATP-binding cassette sub-family C member 9 n=1 Tax=Caerostris extrusa TaxID=172846 RepID=A0AAV4N1W5_CAEEX|nr:ATP-binding cassette sub-family C member 9 [Caerostris extrusa]